MLSGGPKPVMRRITAREFGASCGWAGSLRLKGLSLEYGRQHAPGQRPALNRGCELQPGSADALPGVARRKAARMIAAAICEKRSILQNCGPVQGFPRRLRDRPIAA